VAGGVHRATKFKNQGVKHMRLNIWKANKNTAMVMAVVACMMLAASTSALAVPATQVSRVLTFTTFTGECCSMWNQTVKIGEPAAVVPVLVTWSADVSPNDDFIVGLSVNGGSCIAYGARQIPFLLDLAGSSVLTVTHQWVVLPSDGLKKGTNTFALCGGGTQSALDAISVGLSTLTVQISN
jgi:hypothetical protein